MTAQVRILSDAVNGVVVHVKGRRYPALAAQGDRLKSWKKLAAAGDADSIELLAEEQDEAVAWYDRVAEEHGVGMASQHFRHVAFAAADLVERLRGMEWRYLVGEILPW